MAASALNILMVTSEAAPFAKTGGLGDVTGSLPKALAESGHDIRLVMPWYRGISKTTGTIRSGRTKISVPIGGTVHRVAWRQAETHGVQVYFIDAPGIFDRPGLYGEHGVDYPDNAERFALLSRAALELARHLNFVPHVVHAHDWQTGLVPVYLHKAPWQDPFFADTGSLFSIHNLGYQGVFPLSVNRALGLDESLLTPEGLEFHGKLSLLKAGIAFADLVNTVSPTYCFEIQTPELGMGLDGLLRSRHDTVHGVLNGLDGTLWSPVNDKALVEHYSATAPRGKKSCKAALQKELGLCAKPDVPLAAMVTRIDAQKGIELVLESWDKLMRHDLQLVILGTGNPEYETRLQDVASYYPEKASVLIQFDDALSRRIYSASDLFLMPSRYEPCGLGQMIALRYGSVPVVHATGGLADTVIDSSDLAQGNGFTFSGYQQAQFLEAVARAIEAYQQHETWQDLVFKGMSQDMSWKNAAGEYVELYHSCARVQA